jgi:hypothetical protein
VLVAELFGLSAVLPYGFLLWRYTKPSGSRGLPPDDGRVVMPPDKRFNVHMLVPCYKVGGGSCGGRRALGKAHGFQLRAPRCSLPPPHAHPPYPNPAP